MKNPITAAIIDSMTAPAPAHTITATIVGPDGTPYRATYSANLLDSLRTEPRVLDIQDDTTGELIYIKPDTEETEETTEQVEETETAEDPEPREWYAVMLDRDDDDWGTGSWDRADAMRQLQAARADGHSAAYIAVIADGDDPICTREII